MDGLERMDKPRRWPWFAALGLLAVVLLGWFSTHRARPIEPSADAQLSRAADEQPLTVPPQPQVGPVSVVPATNTPPETSASEKSPIADTGSPSGAVAAVAAHETVASTPVEAETKVTASSLSEAADALLAEGKKDKAREQFIAALAANPAEPLKRSIEKKLGALSVELIRLPWPMAEKQVVLVQEGDSVRALAKKYGTTVELIAKGNELKRPDVIRPGQQLKIFSGKMEITVSKSRNDLLVTAGGRFFKRYRVGTGRYDKTPVGTFVITERIPEPPWWRDDGRTVPFGDKENILGTRWMAIRATGNTPEIKGYGIHGTWDTNSIGKAESAGCIRLKNEDVEELFELVPIGTPVAIEE